jgi:hypothetical protein
MHKLVLFSHWYFISVGGCEAAMIDEDAQWDPEDTDLYAKA